MKIRNGFVSNSSSSSFIIYKSKLSSRELKTLKKIHNHIHIGNKLKIRFCQDCDAWTIEETEEYISGGTLMNNFDMRTFLEYHLEIDSDKIKWNDD